MRMVLIILLSLNVLFAQNYYDEKVSFFANWEVGEVKNFYFEKDVKRYNEQELLMEYTVRNNIEMFVSKLTDSNIFVSWRYTDFQFPDSFEDVAKEISLSFTKIEFNFQLSEIGEFEELTNLTEVRSVFEGVIDSLLQTNIKQESEQLIQQFKTVCSSDESFQEMILKDAKLFYSVYGTEIGINEKDYKIVNFPNFVGGQPFEAESEMYISQIEEVSDFCILKKDVIVDSEKLAELVFEKTKIENFQEGLEISDKFAYNFVLTSGWMNSVYLQKTTNIGGVKKLETQYFLLFENK